MILHTEAKYLLHPVLLVQKNEREGNENKQIVYIMTHKMS